jgi:farnesyl-diphosphate farnesyltransferase
MKPVDLGGPILKAVSRSFYLSVRVLPADLRAPVGLAYLLARASDTIADSAEAPSQVRLEYLAAFGRMVDRGTNEGLLELQADIRPDHQGERELIQRLDGCLHWLASLPPADRDEIRDVMRKIIHGQTLDLQRFPAVADGGMTIVALETAAGLEEYTYLVAGCVGEFWTRISFLHLPAYSEMEAPELCETGRDYGKALQLVNILRDLPADLREGRCYLPMDELRAAGVDPQVLATRPGEAQPVFDRWMDRADELLKSGGMYIRVIRPARVRVACYLPWFLAVQTLKLLRSRSPLTSPERVKVPRSTVRAALMRAPVVAFSNRPLS